MINPIILKNLNIFKKDTLVVDIETSSHYPSGKEVNIRESIDDYIAYAKVKWFGAYSYKHKKQYYLNALTQSKEIVSLLAEHNILVGFNIEDFDYPILNNNGLTPMNKQYNIVDCMVILGTRNQKSKSGYSFKGRGELMDYSFKNNSLRCMAETMNLDIQKGDIDYKIFHKNSWAPEETEEIIKYLSSDVMATKQMFDILWDYWLPFAEFIDEKFVYNLSWLKNSIASLTYKSACKVLQTDPTYGVVSSSAEHMGGNVITPKYEELKGVYYVDVTSLYPHIFSMFNLNAEVHKDNITDSMNVWHGNDVFQVKGYYDISKQHLLAKYIGEKLKERITLKETDPKNPMVYTLKILLNCFSADTDVIMADNTIKNIKDCKVGEYLWSINPITLYAEKKKIIKTYEYDYNGDLHYYEGNYLNFKVTPNHKFLLHKVNNNKGIIENAKFYESNEITTNFKIPIHKNKKKKYKKNINILEYFKKDYFLYSIISKTRHGHDFIAHYKLKNKKYKYNSNNRNFIFDYETLKEKFINILNDKDLIITLFKKSRRREHKKPLLYNNEALSYLIGIYLSEGSATKTESKQYRKTKRGEIYAIQLAQHRNINPTIYKKIQDSLDICGLKYSAGKHGFKVTDSIFYDFLTENFGKLSYKCFVNKNLFNELNLKKVWEGLIDGDGSKKSNLYTTKYDCLKNDFIELCMRLGYTFVIKNDGCWRIVYNNSENVIRPSMRTIENYNGKVYCVEVEDNNTLMAGRNNYFNWSGNSLYGVIRSALFEKVHTPNAGWDCCWLGQQIQQLMQDMLVEFGFEVVGGDTDSLMIKPLKNEYDSKDYVKKCLEQIVNKINDNAPFPSETFNIKLEHRLEYILFPFSFQPLITDEEMKNINNGKMNGFQEEIEGKKKIIKRDNGEVVKIGRSWLKVRQGKKKNYLYIYKDEEGNKQIELIGLPIKKANATPLGLKIYNEVLKPMILEYNTAKFDKKFIDSVLDTYLEKDDVIKTLAIEYRVQKAEEYKKESQIHAQISNAYFQGDSGTICLIKNKKYGKVGKGTKYCTIKEAKEQGLTVEDFDLEKVYNELEPFILYDENLDK